MMWSNRNIWYSGIDNIKMDLNEMGWKGVNWIQMAQDSDQW
jgi:hypothetical protein